MNGRLRRGALLLVAAGSLSAAAAGAQTPAPEAGWIGVDAGLVAAPGMRPVVVVRRVAVGSPAAAAGLVPGDTLVALDGLPPSVERFQALRTNLRPGDPLEVTVRNGRRPRTLVIRAEARPEDVRLGVRVTAEATTSARTGPSGAQWNVALSTGSRAGEADGMEWMTPYLVGQDRVAGARVAPLNPGLAQYFGTERGLLVIEVVPGTPAAAARLLPGDVLLQVGSSPVHELAALRRAVAATAAGPVRVLLIRRGRELEVEFPR